jgi:hypothetical protein
LAGLAVIALGAAGPVLAHDTEQEALGQSSPSEAVEFFESRVRPIFAQRCVKCHGPRKRSSGLRLDNRESILAGGERGPAIVPAKPDESLLIRAVSHADDELKMPPDGKLPEPVVAALRQWVALGAPWPEATANASVPAGSPTERSTAAAAHWAFQPVRRVSPPRVTDTTWVGSPVDAFIRARLDLAGMTPSPRADRRTLIRRATIDLLGLPPTAEEVEAFEGDTAPDAYARLIDRLLASPRYGERWGRHWLDVARYADTKGYVFTQDRRYPYAYTYRDYVIAALNADLGYDQFILQQLAADQLTHGDDRRPLAALGFLTVGRRFLLDQNEIIDDRIDLVCRGLMGLTVACARCHDHKYDPIPTEDYYSLYGVFASSVEPAELPLLRPHADGPGYAGYQRELKAAETARDDYLAKVRDEFWADMKARLSDYLAAADDLKFDQESTRLEERALAGRLNSRRLLGLMILWNRRLAAGEHDPVLGPWRAFAAVPAAQFADGARNAHRELTAPKEAKRTPVHPLVANEVLAGPPANMGEVVARYVALFAGLERRWKEHNGRSKSPGTVGRGLPEPEWESLRQAIFGTDGALAVSTQGMEFLLDQSQRDRLGALDGAISQVNATHPAAPARAMVLVDAPQPVEPQVFVRGNPARPGAAVPRRFLRVLSGSDRTPFQRGSGRLELARAIADARNPLTARVIANRVWQWHFGRGLVATPSDFGLRSDPPAHPELLDYLAGELVASGWSLKTLHRRILNSSTYQQQSELRPAELERDPENRLLWRFPRQRLDFESMRDSVLAVSGSLGPRCGGPSTPITAPTFSVRRTLYGLIDRQNLDGDYRTFDFAVPDATSPRRFVTTVPQQALFLMNSPFLHEQARRLAAAIRPGSGSGSHDDKSKPKDDTAEGVRRLYRRVVGRAPDAHELALATEFIRRQTQAPAGSSKEKQTVAAAAGDPPLSAWAQLSQVLLLTNEFMYVD